jgi:hypothetical protein
MLDQLQSWWESTTPEARMAAQEIGVVLLALIGGHILGGMVARALRGRHFDAALRVPAEEPDADRGFTPTFVAGLLVRLTVWAGAVWWLATKHGQIEFADRLGLVVRRTWALAAVLVAALALGTLLARRLIDCLQAQPRPGPDASRNGSVASHRSAAGVVGAGAYVLAMLLVLLIAADSFDWPLTRSAALALWQFAQHLLVASAALAIGLLGARWARDLATPDGAPSPEKRAGQYTALGIAAATTVLAVAVLLSSAGVLIGLAALAVLGVVLWLVRGYLPDVTAGWQLRAHKVRQVGSDAAPWKVLEVGFLSTRVGRDGEFYQLGNRALLQALVRGGPPEPAAR